MNNHLHKYTRERNESRIFQYINGQQTGLEYKNVILSNLYTIIILWVFLWGMKVLLKKLYSVIHA